MIPEPVTSAFIAAALATTFLPVSLIIIFCAVRKINVKPMLAGTAAFVLAQIVIQIPVISFLSGMGWLQSLNDNQFPLYALTLSLIAGLAGESVRLGGARLLKKDRSFRDAVSFGLGYALLEIVLFSGISFVGNALMCVAINSSGQFPQEAVPADVFADAIVQLSVIDPADILWAILELASISLMHIFMTALVFKSVVKKNMNFYFAAVLAHVIFNLATILLNRYMAASAVALLELAVAVAAMAFIIKSRPQ